MNKLLTGLLGSILMLGSAASFAQEVVLPGDSKGWFERQSNVGTIGLGGADSASGTGSLSMITTGSGGDILKIARIPISLPVTTVGSLTSIGWEVQTDNATNYPRPQIEYYDLFNQFGGRFGTLVYESGNQTPTADGVTWNAYSVNFAGDLFRDSFSGDTKTLAEWQADPAVGGIPVNYFQIGYGSTGGATTATTAIDFVELDGTTWDFEASVAPGLAADVSVVSTLDTTGPFTAGDTVEYTVTVSNAGPDAATNIAVVGADAGFGVPVNLAVTSVSGATCNANPCTIPSLASGGSEVIAVMATIQAAGQFSYPVGVLGDQDDPDFTNNASIPPAEDAAAPPPTTPAPATPVPTMSAYGLVLTMLGLLFVATRRLRTSAKR